MADLPKGLILVGNWSVDGCQPPLQDQLLLFLLMLDSTAH